MNKCGDCRKIFNGYCPFTQRVGYEVACQEFEPKPWMYFNFGGFLFFVSWILLAANAVYDIIKEWIK